MSTIAPHSPTGTVVQRSARTTAPPPIPLTHIVFDELRKSFDTRAGFWLLASIGLASLLATGAVILFAPADQVTYSTFTLATEQWTQLGMTTVVWLVVPLTVGVVTLLRAEVK